MKKAIWLLMLLCVAIGSWAVENSVLFTIDQQTIAAGKECKITAVFQIPEGYHQSYEKGVNDYFYLDVEGPKDFRSAPTKYPEGKAARGGLVEYKHTVTLTKVVKLASTMKAGNYTITAKAGYQYCDESGTCFMPQEESKAFTLSVSAAEQTEEPVEQVTTVQDTIPTKATAPVTPVDNNKTTNVLRFIFMAFLGGIILNIMPCVLPVLSIKAMSIVKQSHEDKKKILLHSYVYTAGILVSFLVLAAFVIVLKASGEAVGWGFQFQNVNFVIGLTSVIFLFALSLFDVFIINAPGMNQATRATQSGGLSGSFVSGIFAVLLATPCTAPFLGAALGFAFSQPPVIILAIFIAVGLGLSLPFLLLGIFPAIIKKLPKPGEWMNVFKELMGFLLIATVIWLLDVVLQQLGGKNLLRVIMFLGGLALAAWTYGRFARPEFSRTKQWVFLFIAIAIAVGAGTVFLHFAPYNQEATAEGTYEWKNFNPQEVEKLIASGEPVFIDFTAKWCMTCKVNENTVLYTDEVSAAMKKAKLHLFKADFTSGDKTVGAWIKKYGRAGVPVYVLYTGSKPEPIVLPELLTKELVLKALSEIK